ncbi:MAG TPA: nucleotidyltransferase domain-containing protein [Planctomycetota bacterium]|nr:nucleotidyltransferase domain-containing protein [Planctomycetota bacterium]
MDPSQLSPNFIIPLGTQVVLKKDLPVMGAVFDADGKHVFKKAGSVGVVREAPLTNEYSYLIEFTDKQAVRALKTEIVVRRTDAPEDELPARELAAFEPYLVYRVRMGSKAFGLADESSDNDERGVYVPPAEWHWSLQPLPEQIEFKRMADGRTLDHNSSEEANDFCWWELEKFLRLALKANPNILESLYVGEANVLHCDAIGRKLRELRPAFLSKYLYQTYSGYVLSQFKKLKRQVETGGEPRPKHAMHLIRLLYSGIEALRGRGILVDVGEYRAELLSIKRGELSFEQVYARALELNVVFQDEYGKTALPERPDVEAVDRFLIETRRSRV